MSLVHIMLKILFGFGIRVLEAQRALHERRAEMLKKRLAKEAVEQEGSRQDHEEAERALHQAKVQCLQ